MASATGETVRTLHCCLCSLRHGSSPCLLRCTMTKSATSDKDRQVWVGNVPAHYTIDDVRCGVFDAGYAWPCHVKLEWARCDTRCCILTFRVKAQAEAMLEASWWPDALIWKECGYAVIRRPRGKVQCSLVLTSWPVASPGPLTTPHWLRHLCGCEFLLF